MSIQTEVRPIADTTMAPPDTHFDVLLDALERLDGAGPEFGGFLANHGPMAADSLSRLGGAPPRVAFWVDIYRRSLEDAPIDTGRVDDATWQHHLGHGPLLGDWIGHFDRSIRVIGWREVVATWWPRLLPGTAAGAAHGLIRSAHAIRSLAEAPIEDDRFGYELAQGLGYWAARYQPLPGKPALTGSLTVFQALDALPRLDPSVPSVGPGLAGRFTSLVSLRALPDALDGWGATDVHDSLDELVSASARLLANRIDAPIAFCHAVTAPAAMRMVIDELPPALRLPSLAASWQIVGAIVAGFAFPARTQDLADVSDVAEPTPASLAEAAIEHGDDHVLKLTEAALRQYAHTGDSTLLIAAERFRDRMPRPEVNW